VAGRILHQARVALTKRDKNTGIQTISIDGQDLRMRFENQKETDYVRIVAFNASAQTTADALLKTGAIQFFGQEQLAAAKATFNFEAISANALLRLIADVGQLVVTYRADNALQLRVPRKDARFKALHEQLFNDRDLSKPEVLKTFEAMRDLERVRGTGDLPPRSDMLWELAQHYRKSKNFAVLLALREQQLKSAQAYDARAGSPESAFLQLLLQHAKVLAGQKVNDIRLEAITPEILGAGATAEQIEIAEFLALQKHEQHAGLAYEIALNGLNDGDAWVWLTAARPIVASLVVNYQNRKEQTKLQALLKRWRATIDVEPSFASEGQAQAYESLTNYAIANAHQQAEIGLALLPSASRESASSIADWQSVAYATALATGRFDQALVLHQAHSEALKSYLDANDPILIERTAEANWLAQLIAQSPKIAHLFTYRPEKIPVDQGIKNPQVTFSGLYMQAIFLQAGLSKYLEHHAIPEPDVIEAMENTALTSTWINRDLVDNQIASKLFEKSLSWRMQKGESAKQMQWRRLRFEQTTKAAKTIP
jgi:hypothetical protein